MRRVLVIIATVVLTLIFVLLVGGFFALRDNPARDAVGWRRYAESGDAVISYFVHGPEQGPVVALIPSYARSASDFNELVLVLSTAGLRTVAMQPRGIDGSDLPSFDPTLATYADDLLAVLDAEGRDEPAIVLGHAYGNRIARAFAQSHPSRVDSLILLAAGGEFPTPEEGTVDIGKSVFGIYPDGVRRKAIARAFFARGNVVPDSWMRGWYPMAAIAEANATASSPYETWGEGGSAPIFVLEPAEDAVAAGAGERLRARFPDRVRVEMVEGAGHALLPEQPEFIMHRILEFAAERIAARGSALAAGDG